MGRRRRFRRTRRVGIACALLALLLVGGPGRGVSTQSGSRQPALAALGDAGATPVEDASGRSPRTVDTGTTTAENSAAAEDASTDAQARDLVFGVLAEAEQASSRGELSVALRLLDSVAGALGHPVLAPPIEHARASLRAALDDATARLALDLAAGRVLRAARRVDGLVADLHPIVAARLDEEWARRGWPPRLAAVPDPGLPVGADLSDRRSVLLALGTEWREGTVMGGPAAGGDLTVRVETAAGVVFPTVGREALELSQPTALEIEGQLRACMRAGRASAVWAWWVLARVRGQTLGPELARALGAAPR